jgi:O-antigen/teichoic acid export membrane protein
VSIEVTESAVPSEARAQEALGMASGKRAAAGTLQFLSVQVLALPIGLFIAAFVTRILGPELYGLFVTASSIVVWIELSASLGFRSTTVKFVAESADWQGVASTLLQVQLLISVIAAGILVIVSPILASWLGSPEMTRYLRLFAVEIPIFTIGHLLSSVLIGRGRFSQAALVTAVGWAGRLILVLVLLGLGFSVTGAILAVIGSSVGQVILALKFARPALSRRFAISLPEVAGYVMPLLGYGMAMRLYSRVDLLAVKAWAGTAEAAGLYGAAQNLTTAPLAILATSFSPLLLATVSQLSREGQVRISKAVIRQAMRLVLCLAPFGGLLAGAASEVVLLIYGDQYLASVPVVAVLLFGGLALTMIRISAAVLIAEARPVWPLALSGPLVAALLGACLLLVPRLGAVGAAVSAAGLASLGAGISVWGVYRRTGVAPPLATIVRVAVTTMIAYGLACAWRTPGAWVVVKLAAVSALSLACLFLVKELTAEDLAFVRSLLRSERKIPT